jgi:hypothetical protein
MPDWIYALLGLLILAGGFGLACSLAHLVSCWRVMRQLDLIQKGDKQ